MDNGISIYPGLDNTLEENIDLIERAHHCGFRRIFTSLHIPETNYDALKSELSDLLRTARRCDMEVISDISPATMELLGIREFSPSAFRMLGITTLRLDYGFGLEEIAELTRNKLGLRIQLNASTITGRMLSALMELKADFHQLDALHNFYPRRGTGISEEFMVRKTMMLHKVGIKTGAFVPSQHRRRSPLKDGLPTLEDHREESADLAARHLIALGIDSVFIADSLPSDDELQLVGSLNDDLVTLQAYLLKAAETGVKRGTLDLDLNASVKKGILHAPGTLTLKNLELSSTSGTLMALTCAVSSAAGGVLRLERYHITPTTTPAIAGIKNAQRQPVDIVTQATNGGARISPND